MDGTCDVGGCTNETFMGWRPLTESRGKQICEDHWTRHKDPADSFNLFDVFGFNRPAGIRRPAPKPIIEKPRPQLAPEPDRGRVVCTEPDVTPDPAQAEPERREPSRSGNPCRKEATRSFMETIETVQRQVPPKYQGMYDRRAKSRKAAVRSFCIECVGYVEKEVDLCTDKGCPLYSWRQTG